MDAEKTAARWSGIRPDQSVTHTGMLPAVLREDRQPSSFIYVRLHSAYSQIFCRVIVARDNNVSCFAGTSLDAT